VFVSLPNLQLESFLGGSALQGLVLRQLAFLIKFEAMGMRVKNVNNQKLIFIAKIESVLLN
jgi:hypothetical protein